MLMKKLVGDGLKEVLVVRLSPKPQYIPYLLEIHLPIQFYRGLQRADYHTPSKASHVSGRININQLAADRTADQMVVLFFSCGCCFTYLCLGSCLGLRGM